MKKLAICASALALMTGAAFAENTVIRHDGPDATVIHRSAGPTVDEKVIDHDSDGCSSKTVTKTNDMGDSVSKTKSNC